MCLVHCQVGFVHLFTYLLMLILNMKFGDLLNIYLKNDGALRQMLAVGGNIAACITTLATDTCFRHWSDRLLRTSYTLEIKAIQCV